MPDCQLLLPEADKSYDEATEIWQADVKLASCLSVSLRPKGRVENEIVEMFSVFEGRAKRNARVNSNEQRSTSLCTTISRAAFYHRHGLFRYKNRYKNRFSISQTTIHL